MEKKAMDISYETHTWKILSSEASLAAAIALEWYSGKILEESNIQRQLLLDNICRSSHMCSQSQMT